MDLLVINFVMEYICFIKKYDCFITSSNLRATRRGVAIATYFLPFKQVRFAKKTNYGTNEKKL